MRTGLSRVTIWRLEKQGKFPQRLQLTIGTVGWIDDEVDKWLQSRPRVPNRHKWAQE